MWFWENIESSEWSLDKSKQDIKNFLKEVAEKSSNQKLDNIIDNSDYKDLSEKEKKEKAIDAILKLWWDKYNYLKTWKALPLDLLERMVDEIEDVNQDTQNAINLIKSSRLESKKEVSLDVSINQTSNNVSNNLVDSNPSMIINTNNSIKWDLENISKWIPESLNSQKTKFLNLIKDSKNEIQLLLEETKRYGWINWMIEISNSLWEQLTKLSELEIKLNTLIKNNLIKHWKLDWSSILENEKLFSNIMLELSNINNSIVLQWKKLTNIADFKNSTFLWWWKDIFNWNSIDWFKQIGKTILRLNNKLIDSQEEYERDYHIRLWLYPIGENTEIYWDWVWVAHQFNKKWLKASAQQWVTHQWTLENLLNHERWGQYLFLVAEELYKEKWINPILASWLATVTSSVLMYLREYESWRVTPWDVPILTVIDLWNWNKLEANVTIAWSGHIKIEFPHIDDYIPWASKYIKYFKFDWMINEWGWFKNGWIEKEAKHQLYNDQRFITKLVLSNWGTLDFSYNHNDILSKELKSSLYNFDNMYWTYTQDVNLFKNENSEINGSITWWLWTSQLIWNDKVNFWIWWIWLNWSTKIWDNTTLSWWIKGVVYPTTKGNVYVWWKADLDLKYNMGDWYYTKASWSVTNNYLEDNWLNSNEKRIKVSIWKDWVWEVYAWVTNDHTTVWPDWKTNTGGISGIRDSDWVPVIGFDTKF